MNQSLAPTSATLPIADDHDTDRGLTHMPRGVQRSRLIWRRTPRGGEQAESLKPSTLRAVVVLQWNGLKWYRITVAAARGGDRDERSRARTGLDPALQRGLYVCVGMRDRDDDVVV